MSTKRKPVFEVSQTGIGWTWDLFTGNGVQIATSARLYDRKRDCLRAVDTVLVAIFDADIHVIE